MPSGLAAEASLTRVWTSTAAEWHVGVACSDPPASFLRKGVDCVDPEQDAIRPYKLPGGLAAAVLQAALIIYALENDYSSQITRCSPYAPGTMDSRKKNVWF